MGRETREIDCALIFMLDEERDLFLKNNKDFIITTPINSEGFIEFTFFDKKLLLRKGVICSQGKKMGNTEACQLFYKLSRYYKAHLYINIGVAAVIEGVNIGDVVIAERISTMGENNANTAKRQIEDFPYKNSVASIVQNLNSSLNLFTQESKKAISQFKNKLKAKGLDYDQIYNIKFTENIIRSGWCLTVPEVIKDIEKSPDLKDLRKLHLIDMEAYYFALWHDLVKQHEPENSLKDSVFLAIKSVSDCRDENKGLMEESGSRIMAMNNLYTVVSEYCTEIHSYNRQTKTDIYDYFNETILEHSIDPFARKAEISLEKVENLFKYIVHFEDEDSLNPITTPLKAVESILLQKNRALLFKGLSGTGKSTFLSYLYKQLANVEKCILVDFSKHSPSMPEDTQLAILVERIIRKNLKCLMFLDGLTVNSMPYRVIRDILDNNDYSNLSICIGNIDDDYDDLCSVISSRKEITQISFCGVSVFSPDFEGFIQDSEGFFTSINDSYRQEIILPFIRDSKINSVDFRLLAMIVNYTGDLSKKKSLHTFIRDYVTNKYSNRKIIDYWSLFSGNSPEELRRNPLHANPYFHSLALVQGMVNTFTSTEGDQDKERKQILKRSYVLSNDMNLLFEYVLRNKKNHAVIVSNMLNALKSSTASISTETQFLYTISRTISPGTAPYKVFKKVVKEKISEIEVMLKETDSPDFYSYLIQYRTLCIILNSCLMEKAYLEKFNFKLICNIDNYVKCNLLFHLFYYSKREFEFQKLDGFDLDAADYEMYSNTFYTLLNSLSSVSRLGATIVSEDPQTVMNILTLLHLIQSMQKSSIGIKKLIYLAIPVLNDLILMIKSSMNRVINSEQYTQIAILAKEIVDQIEPPTT